MINLKLSRICSWLSYGLECGNEHYGQLKEIKIPPNQINTFGAVNPYYYIEDIKDK